MSATDDIINNMATRLIAAMDANVKTMKDKMSLKERRVMEVNIEEFKRRGGDDYMKEVARSHYEIYRELATPVPTPELVLKGFKVFNASAEIIQYVQENPELLHALGKYMAAKIAIKARERFNIEFPINDLFASDVIEQLDAFLCNEINTRTGLAFTSVLNSHDLISYIKSQVMDKLTEEIQNILIQQKGQLIQDIITNENQEIAQVKIAQLQALYSQVISNFSLINLAGFHVGGIVSLRRETQKSIANKMRQRKYRKTHKEVRHWVHT